MGEGKLRHYRRSMASSDAHRKNNKTDCDLLWYCEAQGELEQQRHMGLSSPSGFDLVFFNLRQVAHSLLNVSSISYFYSLQLLIVCYSWIIELYTEPFKEN